MLRLHIVEIMIQSCMLRARWIPNNSSFTTIINQINNRISELKFVVCKQIVQFLQYWAQTIYYGIIPRLVIKFLWWAIIFAFWSIFHNKSSSRGLDLLYWDVIRCSRTMLLKQELLLLLAWIVWENNWIT